MAFSSLLLFMFLILKVVIVTGLKVLPLDGLSSVEIR